ncbi:2-oxoacid:acceptor oxidoreductase family protein, partial [Fibrobacter sp. UBA4309]|uniref:2-oxoacid:acceptor oxidoreductase family protein n=1 Tax=Fibrobacter sp. UBA4309 TaxID=1946537 RepID=UPI0025C4F61B
GMSQRGGSIASDVRFAKDEEVQSPMIPTGEADYLVVFDETQVVVNEAFLKQGGVLLTPADIDVSKLENVKALNVAMLGKLSKHFDFTVEQWTVALNKLFAEKFHEGNKKAFMLGREG